MLKKFEVNNFRKFNDTLVFDLASAKNYEFNSDCVKNSIVKTALIYGENASGKSNLGWAIFDIVLHLTDDSNTKCLPRYPYLNASSDQNVAQFSYTFYLNNTDVIYSYEKNESRKLLSEILIIGGKTVVSYQLGQPLVSNLKGTEHLNKNLGADSNLSALKYIHNNANLDSRIKNNKIFKQLIKFVTEMLLFRTLPDSISYIGFTDGMSNFYQDILQNGNLKDFEAFLNESGITCELAVIENNGEPTIGFRFDKKVIPITAIASTGTKSLGLFYYWWQKLRENKVSILFIDEFDSSYHFKLSTAIVKRLNLLDTQVILTTHNTALLSNDLIRPDCGFVIDGKTIKPLHQLTDKELRNAHNLEKMYRAGAFNG